MGLTNIYVDEGFLSKLSKKFGSGKYIKIDYLKFSQAISKELNFKTNKIYYYTAPPFQSPIPTKEEKKRKKGYDKFISILKKQKITVREGRCQYLREENKYFQKGVDTNLTIDLMKLQSQNIKKIILVTCDSDFVPIIKEIHKFKVKTYLFTYYDKNRKSNFSYSTEILKNVEKHYLLRKEDFENSKLKTKKSHKKRLK